MLRLILVAIIFGAASAYMMKDFGPIYFEPRDCTWDPWTNWSPCEKSPYGGYDQMRYRTWNPAARGGKDCEGLCIEYQKCGTDFSGNDPDGSGRTISLPTLPGCSWSAWVSTGQCLKLPSGKYGTLRRRNKEETFFGICEGNATDYIECNETSFFTSTFVASLASALVGKPAKSKGESCSRNVYDSKNKLKLVGNCPFQRSKRDLFELSNFEKLRTKRQVTVNHRDVLFLIDESGSIRGDLFEKTKELIVAMIDTFCGEVLEIAPSKTRVGVMTFSSNPSEIHLKFHDFYDPEVIKKKVMDIQYGGGGTCLVDALQDAREDVFRNVNGARVDKNRISLPGTEKFVIFITDGCGNCERDKIPRALENEGILLRHEKVSVFTMAIGSTCLQDLAKLDEQSTCYTTTDVNAHGGIDMFIFLFKFIKNAFKCLENWPFGNPC